MVALRLLVAILVGSSAVPAFAAPATSRLVSCAAGDCLLVRGVRATPASSVALNGQRLAVRGGRAWRVRLPLSTLRALAAPFARTVEVAVAAPDGALERQETVRLPIGLLGASVELASLVVRAR